ncbi:glutamate racemase [Runella sp. SP2]|uniref:glutamate racemase n=1 Tax=Runella sp. SP2 TaxID=2268026 RepID=UPI000F08C014|nr:aspartate/glutamate racemase family protein [Runella sp. SP2]AYQ36554.1 hypothetical protein DTQ70_29990 [Runella sp. SP2]
MKIGVFDSGFGGLSVLSMLRKQYSFDYVYLADTANCPYGDKNVGQIAHLSFEAIASLFDLGADFVVIACNTASTILPSIEAHFPANKVLGIIEPTIVGLKKMSIKSLGVLATQRTVRSALYLDKLSPIPVFQQACPTWASMIERDCIVSEQIHQDVRQLFQKSPEISHLLLGCTHYPFFNIEQYLPIDVQVVSQGQFVADALAEVTQSRPQTDAQSTCQFYTTGSPDAFARRASQLLGYTINCQYLDLTTEKISP